MIMNYSTTGFWNSLRHSSTGMQQPYSSISLSFGRSTAATPSEATSISVLMDPRVCFETFQRHWEQLRDITTVQATVPSPDDVVVFINLLDQMTSLLQIELENSLSVMTRSDDENKENNHPLRQDEDDDDEIFGSRKIGEDDDEEEDLRLYPCLDHLLSENIPAHVLATSRMPIRHDHQDSLRLQQLKLYETLLGSHKKPELLLTHQPILRPLLELLSEFDREDNNNVKNPVPPSSATESHLVILLNQLCNLLMANSDLLAFFFQASSNASNNSKTSSGSSKGNTKSNFLIFSLLIDFLHRDGIVGHQARDALLLCMALSKKHDRVGKYIAAHTNFCPVLATGLSALYSRLPRRLDERLECSTGPRITGNDIDNLPELKSFLSSFEFCDAVIQVSHQTIKENLLGLVYMGFLVPVLGPALTQNQENELICSTAYCELFLRRISEPSLLAIFLRFIFTETVEDRIIIDTLTMRLQTQSQLCVVTLSLFDTLIRMNCEDVMLWLIFRHLIPLKYLLPSQYSSIRQPDLHGRAAEKLLSLTPICCHAFEPDTPDSSLTSTASSGSVRSRQSLGFLVGLSGRPEFENAIYSDGLLCNNYQCYLHDAKISIREHFEATKQWLYPYDGISPPPDSFSEDHDHKKLGATDSSASNSNNNNINNNNNNNNDANETSLVHSSGYQSYNVECQQDVSSGSGGPLSLTEEENTEFWNLMKEPSVSETKLNAAIRRMQQADNLSLSSGGNLSFNSEDLDASLPRTKPYVQISTDDVDLTVTSLGPFLDVMFEKVELMASNNLTANLLVTSIISQLAAFPQPLLRSVLLHPDIVFQPSVRGLFQSIASLKQKLDNIMPTLPGTEEAVILARKFLFERITSYSSNNVNSHNRRDPNASIKSTLNHLGENRSNTMTTATNVIGSSGGSTRKGLTSAFTSMFRKKNPSVNGHHRHSQQYRIELSREVKQQALAAVLLEEWLKELSALAHEYSVLQKQLSFNFGMGLEPNINVNIPKPSLTSAQQPQPSPPRLNEATPPETTSTPLPMLSS